MLKHRNLIVDVRNTGLRSMLRPWATRTFTNFAHHTPIPDSVYILSERCILDSPLDLIVTLANDPAYTIVYANIMEGSATLINQLQRLNLYNLVLEQKILVLAGGDIGPGPLQMVHDNFLSEILSTENVTAQHRTSEIFTKTNKPYNFLFLNGRTRTHRKYLYHRLKDLGLLDQALWSMLESRAPHWGVTAHILSKHFDLFEDGVDIMATAQPLKYLPPEYEPEQFRSFNIDSAGNKFFIKQALFNNKWGDGLVTPEPYIDTYFSLVTETVFESTYSFRTEKIAKPLLMGHPWIAVSTPGFYRDIRNLGFKTFEHLIDESFDQIDAPQQRLDRIVQVVQDLCSRDLDSFVTAAQDTCKYNQQHLAEFGSKTRSEFPNRFFNFINQHRE